MIEREAVRVLLVADDAVLLMQGFDPHQPEAGHWWITPGGGIDEGESLAETVVREVREETGFELTPEQLSPVLATRLCVFEFESNTFRQSESFVTARVERFEPARDGWQEVEVRSLVAFRWWTAEELAASNERIYPRELPALVRAVLDDTISEPLVLSGE